MTGASVPYHLGGPLWDLLQFVNVMFPCTTEPKIGHNTPNVISHFGFADGAYGHVPLVLL